MFPCIHCGQDTTEPNTYCDSCERAYQEAEDFYLSDAYEPTNYANEPWDCQPAVDGWFR